MQFLSCLVAIFKCEKSRLIFVGFGKRFHLRIFTFRNFIFLEADCENYSYLLRSERIWSFQFLRTSRDGVDLARYRKGIIFIYRCSRKSSRIRTYEQPIRNTYRGLPISYVTNIFPSMRLNCLARIYYSHSEVTLDIFNDNLWLLFSEI